MAKFCEQCDEHPESIKVKHTQTTIIQLSNTCVISFHCVTKFYQILNTKRKTHAHSLYLTHKKETLALS
jgi:hypothetical protein